jgi:hypothetical protein
MSRINEAMQRAGGDAPEPTDTRAHDEAFVSGEESPPGPPHEDVTDSGAALAAVEVSPVPVRGGYALQRAPRTAIELRSAEPSDSVELRHLLRMLLARWKLIVTVTAAFIGISMGYNPSSVKIYESRTRLVIEPD